MCSIHVHNSEPNCQERRYTSVCVCISTSSTNMIFHNNTYVLRRNVSPTCALLNGFSWMRTRIFHNELHFHQQCYMFSRDASCYFRRQTFSGMYSAFKWFKFHVCIHMSNKTLFSADFFVAYWALKCVWFVRSVSLYGYLILVGFGTFFRRSHILVFLPCAREHVFSSHIYS